ncbi:hypothetical protein AaE_002245 [Aphanomyces astaci]|uniref:Protein phosphatase 1 regulatory subunit 7 n=1 Tax=Aphanomyces astaci TaxID=112090 RepID=A0A6A5AWX4_APHAT|nr:hypothetical protein AaE_002245 [Aphanomyces astaci]
MMMFTVLDLSFNEIRVIPDLSHLTQLQELYVANNKLTHITGIAALSTLKKLDLGANRIRVIEGLDNLYDLEQLWLGKNKITQIQVCMFASSRTLPTSMAPCMGLEALAKLKIISVQSNRLVSIENLDANANLQEVYLSHNGIAAIQNISHLSKLLILDLGANRIPRIPDMASLQSLEDLWLNDNQVATFDDLVHLTSTTSLQTLYLERNPLASYVCFDVADMFSHIAYISCCHAFKGKVVVY